MCTQEKTKGKRINNAAVVCSGLSVIFSWSLCISVLFKQHITIHIALVSKKKEKRPIRVFSREMLYRSSQDFEMMHSSLGSCPSADDLTYLS